MTLWFQEQPATAQEVPKEPAQATADSAPAQARGAADKTAVEKADTAAAAGTDEGKTKEDEEAKAGDAAAASHPEAASEKDGGKEATTPKDQGDKCGS